MIGYVYIMETPYKGLLKVGLTKRDSNKRQKELSGQTGVLGTFKVIHHYEVPVVLIDIIERQAHKYLKEKNLHHEKEYFCATETQCREAIEIAIDQTNAKQILLEIKKETAEKAAQYILQSELKKKALRAAFISENQALITQIEESFGEFKGCVDSLQQISDKISTIRFLFFSKEVNELYSRKRKARQVLDAAKTKFESAVRTFQQTHKLKRVPLLETIGRYEGIFSDYKQLRRRGW